MITAESTNNMSENYTIKTEKLWITSIHLEYQKGTIEYLCQAYKMKES